MKKWLVVPFLLLFTSALLYSQTDTKDSSVFVLNNSLMPVAPMPDANPCIADGNRAISPCFSFPNINHEFTESTPVSILDWTEYENIKPY